MKQLSPDTHFNLSLIQAVVVMTSVVAGVWVMSGSYKKIEVNMETMIEQSNENQDKLADHETRITVLERS